MNSTRRFVVRTGSAVALLVLLATGFVRADSANYVFQDQTLSFSHLVRTANGTAVGVNDPGFRSLLKSIGATLTWHPGERYVLIATPQPLVLNFAMGQKRYDAGLLSANAAFAPFVQGGEAYLPFDDLMRALSLSPKDDGGTTVLEPQLTSVDVQGSAAQAIVVAHAAIPLHPKMLSDSGDRIVYAFDGVASSIDGARTVDAGGIRSLNVATSGSIRAPRTTLTLMLAPNTRHDPPHSNAGDFEVAFGANGGAPPLVASDAAPVQAPVATTPPSQQPAQPLVTPATSAAPADSQGAAVVSGVTVTPTNNGTTVAIAVSGNATYEWHRLRDPDNRFWIDIKNAQLASGPKDEAEPDPLISIRSRQIDPQTVRVAISLNGAKQLSVSPSASGVVVAVGRDVAVDEVRTGSGTIGSVVSANEPQALVTPVPADMYGQNPSAGDDSTWKFGSGSAYVPTNPRLIVIDPGHGGGDRGAIRNGTSEAELNLMMAKKLQQVLLARGWQVKMTRYDDNDVLATPRSSAEAESLGYHSSASHDLQAREDIANGAGARLMVSIHCNSFINSGPSGTTTYYAKPSDLPFAQIVSRLMSGNLGTKNDGIVKSHLYIPLNAHMPTVLVETAFLSNPGDYGKLTSPDWQERVAEDIADGIDRYAAQYPVSGTAQ